MRLLTKRGRSALRSRGGLHAIPRAEESCTRSVRVLRILRLPPSLCILSRREVNEVSVDGTPGRP